MTETNNSIDLMVTTLAKSIRQKLRDEMARQNLTQHDLAQLLDVSDSKISTAFRSNANNYTLRTIVEIAAALGMAWEVQLR